MLEVETNEKLEKQDNDPGLLSPEWTPYVLSLLTEKEKENDHPKVFGLRRVAEILLGPIINSGPRTTETKDGYANCVYDITFNWMRDGNGYPSSYSGNRVYSGWASGHQDNIKGDPYFRFAEAIAETRAEGRALVRALKLQVVTVDEMYENSGKETSEKKASDVQKKLINKMCKLLDLNSDKLMEYYKITSNTLTYTVAETICQQLNTWRNGPRENIPNEIKGKDAS